MSLLVFAPSALGKTTLLFKDKRFENVFDTDFIIPLLEEFPKVRLFDDNTLYSRLFNALQAILNKCHDVTIFTNLHQAWKLCESSIVFRRSIEDQTHYFVSKGVDFDRAKKWSESIFEATEQIDNNVITVPRDKFLADYADTINNTMLIKRTNESITQFDLARKLMEQAFPEGSQKALVGDYIELREQLMYDLKVIFNIEL